MFFAVIFFVFMGLCFILWAVIKIAEVKMKRAEKREREAREKEYKEKHPHHDAEEFYKACKQNNVNNIEDRADFAKMMRYVDNNFLRLSGQEAKELYLLGKSEVERVQIESLSAEEEEFSKEVDSFVRLYGREKVLELCYPKLNAARYMLNQLKNQNGEILGSADRLYNMSKQKEGDWAIAGGLGGLGAAIDVQINNAEIRAQNAQLSQNISTMAATALMNNFGKIGDATKEVEKWEKIVEKVRKSIVQDLPKELLLKNLSPVLKKQTQSETGAVWITATVQHSTTMTVFDNERAGVKAVADGYLKAVLWDGEDRVGSAILPLSYDGNYAKKELKGICRSSRLKKGKKYDVTFEVGKLWAIEGRPS